MTPELITPPLFLALWALVGYLLGSIPFGSIVTRVMGLGDLRQIGSGNIGATNVLRTGSKLGAGVTLIADVGKASTTVLLARYIAAEDAAQLAGFAAFLGHCYPIWLKFQGGKGVATFFGLLFALSWPIGLVAGATWLSTAALFKYSSLASLAAAAILPILVLFFSSNNLFFLSITLIILIFWRHRGNIIRLLNSAESKIGQK
jgi:glycerol-3-phosphate acyltransferase PlsY